LHRLQARATLDARLSVSTAFSIEESMPWGPSDSTGPTFKRSSDPRLAVGSSAREPALPRPH
jgi:hypothetical protein